MGLLEEEEDIEEDLPDSETCIQNLSRRIKDSSV